MNPEIAPAELLRHVAAGRPGAWAELVRRYTPLLRSRMASYRLQDADAHDVAQFTWLKLAENIHRIHTPEHLGGWLATVVTRESLRVSRERERTLLAEDHIALTPDPEPGPEQRAVDRDVALALRAAVEQLPPRRRALLAALFSDDRRPYTEIAHDLHMPVGSLGPTRARTLTELRRSLELAGVSA